MAERARDLIRQICQAREVVIIRGAISPDHIHMLVAAPPILAPAKLAQYIKGRVIANAAVRVSGAEKTLLGTADQPGHVAGLHWRADQLRGRHLDQPPARQTAV
jgi:REP element-mobilizing transposase RayT